MEGVAFFVGWDWGVRRRSETLRFMIWKKGLGAIMQGVLLGFFSVLLVRVKKITKNHYFLLKLI
ncbi:hypothetical protein [uncultured Brevibacillus sp.]|uniref:hypothetical protein n=1 Tax=uncultured Brevibacillus sp. TaxID=169970 RepID=UPI0025958BA0|nr:hypothetical protein [uncultured Brevibacillus sp.]